MLEIINTIVTMSWPEFFIAGSIISLLTLLTMAMLMHISNGSYEDTDDE